MKSLRFNLARRAITLQLTSGTSRYGPKPEPSSGEADGVIQESYFTYSENEQSVVDHDVHFRPGIGADGHETYTPRTVIYDLKGGFGTLRKFNALYEIEDEPLHGLWCALLYASDICEDC